GYLITLSITTPHKLGFIYALNSIIANLRKFDYNAMVAWNKDNPKDQRNFCIAKVSSPMQQVQIKDDSLRIQQMQASFNAAQTLLGLTPGQAPTGMPQGGFGGPHPGWNGGSPPPFMGGPFGNKFGGAPMNPAANAAAATGLLAN